MIFKKFWEYIEKSITAGISNKVSTTRISSYLILGSILTTGIIYLLIDIVNATIKWKKGEVFIISTEDLIFFGMILTHHLTLLGINKNAETKQYTDLIKLKQENIDFVKKDSETKEEVKNSTTDESTTDESADESATDESTTDESTTDESTTEEPTPSSKRKKNK
jgi:hypothetical protein